MAGAGALLFASGNVLTAEQVNTYLMDQSVMRFANEAARDDAFGGAGEPVLAEGMFCYITGINQFQVYDGSNWKQIVTGATTFLDDIQVNTTGLGVAGVDVTVDAGQYGFLSRANDTNANGSYMAFFKARGSAGSQTIVSSGDDISLIRFFAYDGTAFREAARITVEVDGTPGASDMPGAISFGTTADGGTTLTERMRINNAGLITGTGASLGAWTAYTPTFTNLTVGNATKTFRYCQIGKMVFVSGTFVWGSTTSATSSSTTFTLPVTAQSGTFRGLGHAVYVDSGTQTYWGSVTMNSTTTATLSQFFIGASYVVNSTVSSIVPFTWANGDDVRFQFMYEAA